MKRPPRKPPRRKPARPQPIDDELAELAQILDERRLEAGADGWFELPWRDGRNALGLALEQHQRRMEVPRADAGIEAAVILAEKLILADVRNADTYHAATERLAEIPYTLNTAALRAALRCFQHVIMRSSGELYNGILRNALSFDEDLVLRWRCRDAIGVLPQLENDTDDRRRRAFVIAWKRGLFHAAYAIAPAKAR